MFVINNEKSYISDNGVSYFTTNENAVLATEENKKVIELNGSIYSVYGMYWEDIQTNEKTYYLYK